MPAAPSAPPSRALPSISVVVCTDGRAQSLGRTLHGLRRLAYPEFEICVVCGPTGDNAAVLAQQPPGLLKIAACPARNLSQSRNIGIALAAGDIVAFIDDDAVPEPEWLADLAAAYADPRVGAAGGFVHDPTGVDFQARYVTADRLGGASFNWERPASEFNFPLSASFPHLLGTNCSFRRRALIEVGGFDEEYEYYLDETDLCCRIIDEGWTIAQLAGARVHHAPQSSTIRQGAKTLTSWFPIIKNKIYYALMNRRGHHRVTEVMREVNAMVDGLAWQMDQAVRNGALAEPDRARFWEEVVEAWEVGLKRGMSGQRRLMPPAMRAAAPPALRNAATPPPVGGRRRFCFLSQEYPPAKVGGVGRYIHQLAASVAALGHDVHVLTRGEGQDRVAFEDGTWVHRLAPRNHPPERADGGTPLPTAIWSHAATMRDEIRRIADRRPVHGVYAPIWDCEGAAVLRDGQLPVVTGLQTMLRNWMRSNATRLDDDAFVAGFLNPMLALETEMLRRSPGVHAISSAILDEAEAMYGVAIAGRAAIVPLGLADYRLLPATPPPPPVPGCNLRVLFVGRLESRKGIDILLAAAIPVLQRFPNAQLDIVGNDTIPDAGGSTFRARFAADPRAAAIRGRVAFHGEVDDTALRGFYAACDIFAAPSRFESFGLIFVEAMMFARPTIGCRAGGMPEVIAEGETGLLAEPGDVASLQHCLASLLADPALRARLGEAGRRRYEQYFTPERMAEGVVAAFEQAAHAPAAFRSPMALSAA